MPSFQWASAERASRLLRLVILLLLILVPLAAIYALSMGGVGGDVVYFRDMDGPLRGAELQTPQAPGTRREVVQQCTTTASGRTCTRTERDLKPGEQSNTPTAQPPQHSNFIKADYVQSVAGDPEIDPAAQVAPLPPQPLARGFEVPVPPPPPGAGRLTLAVLSLLFVLGVLCNIERLLKAFEQGSVFAEATVRRLQLVGLFVAALGFLPQVDIFALLRNAALSLVGPAHVGPLPLVPGGGVNIAMVLAGVFTVLIARIVHEAIALEEDVRGTV